MPSSIKNLPLLLLALSALAILAVGPRPEKSLPQNRVIVDYWEKWTGAEQQQMQSIVDDFNNSVGREKNIYVRCVSTSNIDRKTLLAIAAGTPPDVAGMWDFNIAPYAAQDALEPLDDLAAAHHITAASYKKVYWDACHYDGRLYALVSTPASMALVYNKRLFQENAPALRAAGLDAGRPPRTLPELDAYAKALDQFDSRGRLIRAGYLPAVPDLSLYSLYYWFGGKVWNSASQRFTLTSPEVLAAYRWIESYSQRLGVANVTDFIAGLGADNSAQNAFLSGSAVMEVQGPWIANIINYYKPSMAADWAAAPFPSAVPDMENVSLCTFDALAIPRGARHKNEAFEFLAYVNRQDVMEKLCMLQCKNSPLAHVSDHFLHNHPNPHIDVFEKLAGSPNAHAIPQIPIFMQFNDEIYTLSQSVVHLRIAPEPGLLEAQNRLQPLMDEFARNQRVRAGKK